MKQNTAMANDYSVMQFADQSFGLIKHLLEEDRIIATSINEAPLLQMANKANAYAILKEALTNAERTLRALACSELSIDEDRNRTPLRLAQRADVWRAIDQAKAALSSAE